MITRPWDGESIIRPNRHFRDCDCLKEICSDLSDRSGEQGDQGEDSREQTSDDKEMCVAVELVSKMLGNYSRVMEAIAIGLERGKENWCAGSRRKGAPK